MKVPLEVTFRGVEKTEKLEQLIADKAAKIERVCPHMVSCKVAVEAQQKHQQSGNPYYVRVVANVPPEHEIIVKREESRGNLHDTLPGTIRKAFESAERQARELTEQQRHHVKRHPEQELQGIVLRVFPGEDYGFLQSVDGGEIYFHRNSVLHDDFERLEPGTGVRYVESAGEKGPQASTVEVISKPGVRAGKSGNAIDQPPPVEEG
ncbi:MAG: HPF/RaiA family ribosome-associated protein [Thermodesulfobacteriota bacterium]|nr:HPF/RaiA family ribosome-associated protein [Thermodesulfobacteriota bacterium]